MYARCMHKYLCILYSVFLFNYNFWSSIECITLFILLFSIFTFFSLFQIERNKNQLRQAKQYKERNDFFSFWNAAQIGPFLVSGKNVSKHRKDNTKALEESYWTKFTTMYWIESICFGQREIKKTPYILLCKRNLNINNSTGICESANETFN